MSSEEPTVYFEVYESDTDSWPCDRETVKEFQSISIWASNWEADEYIKDSEFLYSRSVMIVKYEDPENDLWYDVRDMDDWEEEDGMLTYTNLSLQELIRYGTLDLSISNLQAA